MVCAEQCGGNQDGKNDGAGAAHVEDVLEKEHEEAN